MYSSVHARHKFRRGVCWLICFLVSGDCCHDQPANVVEATVRQFGYPAGVTCQAIKAMNACPALAAHKQKALCRLTCGFCEVVHMHVEARDECMRACARARVLCVCICACARASVCARLPLLTRALCAGKGGDIPQWLLSCKPGSCCVSWWSTCLWHELDTRGRVLCSVEPVGPCIKCERSAEGGRSAFQAHD